MNESKYSGRYGNYTYNDFIVVNGEITIDKEPGMGAVNSTTGNVYGIYDMLGNRWESVMAFAKNKVGEPSFEWYTYFDSSNFVESKYYDLYEYGSNSSDLTRCKLGDATGELYINVVTVSNVSIRGYTWIWDNKIYNGNISVVGDSTASRSVLVVL